MKLIKLKILFLVLLTSICSCVSVPKETIKLSKHVSSNLVILHNSHKNFVELYYDKIEDNINEFIDKVYTPYIINYVLKDELKLYQKGEKSLYSTIEEAGKIANEKTAKEALNVMMEFQEAALSMINKKRRELLYPILKQKKDLIQKINQSYEETKKANTTLTAYLKSISKLKDAQNEVLSNIGLNDKRETIINSLVKASQMTSETLIKAKEINIKSDEASKQIKEISNKIKSLTKK